MKNIETLKTLLQKGYRYAFSLTHHGADAEDLLHDAWEAVIQAKGQQNQAYLFTAIRSKFINKHRRERLLLMEPLNENDCPCEEIDLPIDIANQQDLQTAMAELRPLEREILFLKAVEGYTVTEIMKLTQHPRGTILSIVHRSKEKLRAMLSQSSSEAQL